MSTVFERLKSDNPVSNARALIACIGTGEASQDEADAMLLLSEKQERVLGFSVGDLALAALDICRIKPYTGNDETVNDLIKNMPGADWVKDVTSQVFGI